MTSTDAIVVRLGPGKFAVDLASVAEVGRMPAVTRVPGLPPWVAGVANWRGRILPILDLRSLLGADAVPAGLRARLLILSDNSVVAGLLVDGVDGTVTFGDEIAAFPGTLSATARGLISGQAPRADGPVALLSVAGIMALRSHLPRGRRSA